MPRWPERTLLQRFEEKYIPEPNSGCWLWIGAHKPKFGYGMFKPDNTKSCRHAHCVSYELYKGKIPDGCEVDHVCQNKYCVNPDHLEAVTHQVNMRRSTRGFVADFLARTHCNHGHPFTGFNVRMRGHGRICVFCDRLRGQRYYQKKKAKK